MESPKLDTPRLRVVMQDGQEFDVQTENPDMVFWDIERAKRKWPTFQDAPFLWINYLAYSKLKRDGLASEAFDAWITRTRIVQNLNEDGAASAEVNGADPTRWDAARALLSSSQ